MEIVKNIIKSKKFWYAFGTLALLLFSDSIGINDQEVNNIIKDFKRNTKSEVIAVSTFNKYSVSKIKSKLLNYVS